MGALDTGKEAMNRPDFIPQPTGPRHCIPITENGGNPPTDFAPKARRYGGGQQALIDLEKMADSISRNPLTEMKVIASKLTYGQMIELAGELWKNRKEDETITQENLPGLLHRWATQ